MRICIKKILFLIASTAFFTGTVLASDQEDVMSRVHQFADGFNKNDTKAIISSCTEDMAIIDDFPPHEWHGPGALSRWMSDYESDAKKNGITDGVVALHKPRHVDIAGDRAYVVVPTDYTYKRKGKKVKQHNSMFTLVLKKGASGWFITAWSWAKA